MCPCYTRDHTEHMCDSIFPPPLSCRLIHVVEYLLVENRKEKKKKKKNYH